MKIGVEPQGLLIARNGLAGPFQCDQSVAEIAPQLGIVGRELDRLVEGLERVVAPALLQQRGAQAGQVCGLGILSQRAGDPLHGEIILLGMKRQQAHEMQGVGVAGIRRERFLAADLGVERPPGAQMAKAGLAQRGRRVGVAHLVLGRSGRPTAVSAVHRCAVLNEEISVSSAARTRASTSA